jgi:hypothetical protein
MAGEEPAGGRVPGKAAGGSRTDVSENRYHAMPPQARQGVDPGSNAGTPGPLPNERLTMATGEPGGPERSG